MHEDYAFSVCLRAPFALPHLSAPFAAIPHAALITAAAAGVDADDVKSGERHGHVPKKGTYTKEGARDGFVVFGLGAVPHDVFDYGCDDDRRRQLSHPKLGTLGVAGSNPNRFFTQQTGKVENGACKRLGGVSHRVIDRVWWRWLPPARNRDDAALALFRFFVDSDTRPRDLWAIEDRAKMCP
uniref:Sulfatase domain-containing protein n=1 Tax=Steinernema glaseri TaxID=37863 RepID=A0A1I8AM42_9BILA